MDAISFMYAGRSLYVGNLWPHNHHKRLFFGDYRTHFYTIQSLGRNRVDLSIGTFAHESGHMLCRFPDLYDYGERDGDFEESSGLGQYCLNDVGRLDTWSITMEYQSQDQISKGQSTPGITIPDEDVGGKQSPIVIEDKGRVKGLSVEVDISHTYVGDVQIELISSSGQRALLHSSNGDSSMNLKETYSEASTASLRALVGEEVNGEWLLHVRDLVPLDEGILNRWAITIRR